MKITNKIGKLYPVGNPSVYAGFRGLYISVLITFFSTFFFFSPIIYITFSTHFQLYNHTQLKCKINVQKPILLHHVNELNRCNDTKIVQYLYSWNSEPPVRLPYPTGGFCFQLLTKHYKPGRRA